MSPFPHLWTDSRARNKYYKSHLKLLVWDRLASVLVLINWQDIKQAENMLSCYPLQHLLLSTVSLLYLAPCCLSHDFNFIIFWRPLPVSQI